MGSVAWIPFVPRLTPVGLTTRLCAHGFCARHGVILVEWKDNTEYSADCGDPIDCLPGKPNVGERCTTGGLLVFSRLLRALLRLIDAG